MRFQNSSFYIQQIIDQILQPHHKYVKVYIDNIVIFSKSLLEHVDHLNTILFTFERLDIVLKSTKFFLSYSSVQLLEQKIDTLDLTISVNKLQAISELNFSKFLKDLEIYLNMINYLQQYILYYTQVFTSFQSCKIMLLKNVSSSGWARKIESSKANLLMSTSAELESFHQLQTLFARLTMLTHYNHIRSMFIDLDVSQQRIGTMIYHTAGNDITAISQKS